jgi:ribonuclease BN (tRNA processing enzyme)
MELTIIGSASAEPNPGSASSCYLVDAGAGQLVLECGHGAAAKLLLYTSIERVGGVLISHMHPDHFFDLLPLRYLITFHRRPRLSMYIPPTGPGVLTRLAVALGEKPDYWDAAYDIHVFDPGAGLSILGLEITMASGHHFIPAWSMRFRAGGSTRDLGYTSDTSFAESVVSHLEGVALLLAESSVEHQTKPEHDRGHMTAAEAGRFAGRVGAERLVLTHYPHALAAKMKHHAEETFGGPCDLAVEGGKYTI